MNEEQLNALVDRMSLEVTDNRQSIIDFMAEYGIINPRESLIRRLMKRFDIKRCCSCLYVGDSEGELNKHLAEKKHYYGQLRYANDKRALIHRVKSRLTAAEIETHLPDVDLESPSKLTAIEKSAFSSLASNEHLTPGERATLANILYLGYNLIYLRGTRK